MNNKKWVVYRYLNVSKQVIYVGLTSRPIKARVREHKIEELQNETFIIEYIELPNETQMNQYEEYYINLWKPKFNKQSVFDGIPIALPEYSWIEYWRNESKESSYSKNLFCLETIFNKLNDTLFNGKISASISITDKKAQHICINENKIYIDNGVLKYPISIYEESILTNSQDVITEMLTQMVLIYGLINNKKLTSNNGVYKNRYFKEIAKEYGLLVENMPKKYGYEPYGITDKTREITKEFGFNKVEIFNRNNKYNKKTSTRKYICPSCNNSFRATKNLNVKCVECNKLFVLV